MPLYSANGNSIIGGKKHSSGSTPPVSPSKGDCWHELDNQDNYVMSWFYKDGFWISSAIGNFTSFFGGVIGSNQTHRFSPPFVSLTAKFYIVNLTFGGIVTAPNDSSNYLKVSLDGYYGNSQRYTDWAQLTTQGLTANTIGRRIVTINDFMPQGVDFLYLNYTRVGNPGAFNGGASVLFRYVR